MSISRTSHPSLRSAAAAAAPVRRETSRSAETHQGTRPLSSRRMRAVQNIEVPPHFDLGQEQDAAGHPHRALARDRSRRTSAAVARPLFTRKFACFSEKQASPSRSPFIPARSSSSLAFPTFPGGFRNADPKVFSPHGWLARRFSFVCRIRSNTDSLVPGAKRETRPDDDPLNGVFCLTVPEPDLPCLDPVDLPPASTTSTHSVSAPMFCRRPRRHRQRAAYRPRDSGERLHSGKSRQGAEHRHPWEHHTRLRDHRAGGEEHDLRKVLLGAQHGGGHPAVGHEEVAPRPEDPDRPALPALRHDEFPDLRGDRGNTIRSAGPPIPIVVCSRNFTWNETSMFRTIAGTSLPLPSLPREKAFSQFPDIARSIVRKISPAAGGPGPPPPPGGFSQYRASRCPCSRTARHNASPVAPSIGSSRRSRRRTRTARRRPGTRRGTPEQCPRPAVPMRLKPTTMRRSGQTSRAAARVARTSAGWWP